MKKQTKNNIKGQLCSISGSNYEKTIFKIVTKCVLNDKKFNTQAITELGNSKSINDIQCNFNTKNDIGIEIKKFKTPDWMQCSIKYNFETNKWESSKNGKIPKECSQLFNKLINNINLYDDDIPPFIEKKITHEEWLSIKKKTKKWNDVYVDIPNDTIKKMYNYKKCQYIQISDGYGLYHLGDDICKFNVPEFIIEQQLRIRTKIHSKKDKNGFCKLSIIAACQPKNIKLLEKSNYSLDDDKRLPINIIYPDK
ncbi:hypothetical protein BMW23_0536 [Bodo saltans virus]|uniref:Uncharacterized protein n=1 Tax=Bodo saltans virus TaxID=2024608 RepID=A0A2H4UUH1_9VIRU|nr:hypothetical protein QJ851_gp0520 [Bodo saltans virus]ATZ80583.1 hypothetical protein BMW23_0536 [Bodo saltans virus]